jgi:hypothetical protein
MPAPQTLHDELDRVFDDHVSAAQLAVSAAAADTAAASASTAAQQAHAAADQKAAAVKTEEGAFVADVQTALEGSPTSTASSSATST